MLRSRNNLTPASIHKHLDKKRIELVNIGGTDAVIEVGQEENRTRQHRRYRCGYRSFAMVLFLLPSIFPIPIPTPSHTNSHNFRCFDILDSACLRHDVERLVYTSTYNVVFGGQEIRNGDETLPYLEDHMFTDHYSKTKMLAERKVLASEGAITHMGRKLRVCVLRLAGVYGPGEMRHIPRIVSYLEQGLVKITYGSRDSKVDFLHVDNLAQAHALAAEALTSQKQHVAAGKAYFISDNKPVNNFEFFRPLFEGLGYGYPKVNLPLLPVFYFAWLTELVHGLVSPVHNFQPILTRTEVYKTGVTHYFSTEAARNDLGYNPTVQNDLSGVVTFYKKLGRVKGHQSSTLLYYVVNIIIIFLIYMAIMFFLPRVTGL
ncbi:short-chain dehydrogenase/reductase family 42E member 1-like [Elysia marginata]|uniref:Short-chain dehydrogenase/reductase family 42E member 1-like n=1 Tax=Elysia marginata TaxID=1093978 RepID=A0AAV4GFP1_9GAST|nr:short-chain dehydrogenase/reductase family 42E member 1-like [Elysia marginata]